MEQELANKIINKCPTLFSDLKEIEAPDGWFKIINYASTLIEDELKIVPLELQGQIYVVQIKSKFGGLRYYLNKSTPYINGVIALAESLSYDACEVCGSLGEGRSLGGWGTTTLCDAHFQERQKENARTKK